MKFERNVQFYLSGDLFSSGIEVKICDKEQKLTDRISIISEKCYNKKVIHLGCADHIDIIETKIKNRTWLHEIICNCADKCLGIDSNSEAIQYVREKLGYENLICRDILTEDCTEILAETWDYMILGEMLEHVNDPFQFLQIIRRKFGKNIDRLLVTVPNAFAFQNYLMALKSRELINSDHRFWFTPYTLAKIASEAGYFVEDFEFCMPTPYVLPINSFLDFRKRKYLRMIKKYPSLRVTMVMTLRNTSIDEQPF